MPDKVWILTYLTNEQKFIFLLTSSKNIDIVRSFAKFICNSSKHATVTQINVFARNYMSCSSSNACKICGIGLGVWVAKLGHGGPLVYVVRVDGWERVGKGVMRKGDGMKSMHNECNMFFFLFFVLLFGYLI